MSILNFKPSEHYIQKLFFNKFKYKLVFYFDKKNISLKREELEQYLNSKNVEFKIKYTYKDIPGIVNKPRNYYRLDTKTLSNTIVSYTGTKTISLFLNDYQEYENLKSLYSNKIMEFHFPKNKKHADILQDRMILTREKYYFNKYKFKIILISDIAAKRLNLIEDFNECLNYYKELEANDNANFRIKQNTTYPNLYFNDEEEVTHIKLSYSHIIESITEIVLTQSV